MGLTSWYKDPVMLNAFWIVIIIQIAVLIFSLKKSASQNSYWQQVKSGTLISLCGGVIIFLFSYFFTSVLYPNYFNELKSINEQMLKNQGLNDLQIKMLIEQQAVYQTSFWQALFGFLGTVVTGFIISLIVGAIFKKKNSID